MKLGHTLDAFVAESNRIEGIRRPPTPEELAEAELFLITQLTVEGLERFVSVYAMARLRDRRGMNVRVGTHVAPPGGPEIRRTLQALCEEAADEVGGRSPYLMHHAYETLHPFTDGNGRSGRILWLWMMKQRGEYDRALALGFLHSWYYQSLEAGR